MADALVERAKRRNPDKEFHDIEKRILASRFYGVLHEGMTNLQTVVLETELPDGLPDTCHLWAAKVFDITPAAVTPTTRNWVKEQAFLFTFGHQLLLGAVDRAYEHQWVGFLRHLVSLGLGPEECLE